MKENENNKNFEDYLTVLTRRVCQGIFEDSKDLF
jgi:hypothetical protein